MSADVQVLSVVLTFGACSSSILGAHHTGDRGGARTLPSSVSSLVDSTLLLLVGDTIALLLKHQSAAPDARSLQDPAKDPRLKMSGRR